MIWKPNKKQEIALSLREVDILFYGGARGGGKTAYLLADFLLGANEFGEHWRGILFRRTLPELNEVIALGRQMYMGLGADYNKAEKVFVFKNGSELRLSYLESDSDVERYQGHNHPWIAFDELGNYPTDYCFNYMIMCNRSAQVPQDWIRMRATGNPGGPGHLWLKERFIEGKTPYKVYKELQGVVNGKEMYTTSCFVPATLQDNEDLMQKNPQYIAKLMSMPERIRKAMLEGNWDLKGGAEFFDQFDSSKHVIEPSMLKGDWYRFYAMDWGYKSPYAVLKLAVDSDGRVIVYGEFYGQGKNENGREQKNLGTQEGSNEVAAKVYADMVQEGVTEIIADYNMWEKKFSELMPVTDFYNLGITMIKANKKHAIGWNCVHELLKLRDEFGNPYLRIFNTCKYLIRELEHVQASKTNPEEVKDGEADHAVDALRYGLVSPLYNRRDGRRQAVVSGFTKKYNPLEHGYFAKHF